MKQIEKKVILNNYFIYRTDDDLGWDEYIGFVVCAKNKRQAKKMMRSADEVNKAVWKIKNIGVSVYKKPRVLLESFNAG